MNRMQNQQALGFSRTISDSNDDSCQELLNRIKSAKEDLLSEFRPSVGPYDRMLRLALNEAEGLARETDFPLLVFPTLAREKAEAVTAWKVRQQGMRNHVLQSFAA
jgi:hypothetical protein